MKNTNSARQDNKAANILGLLCVFCWLVSIPLFASDITIIPGHSDNNSQNVEIEQPAISIIIDDLGYTKSRDARALKLPGNVTYSFLPHTPYARELAIQAHRLNKEVMLHQPMEALSHKKLGPGGLTAEMTRNQYIAQLESNLESVPYAVGINNHMGSLLTQFPGQMRWVMKELAKHSNLYFVDSYTTATSIGQKTARENWVPTIRRDVFLDTDRDPGKIRKNFRRLIKKAKTTGIALAIGHPYPETMAILEKELPKLSEKGIKLLPVSELLATRTNRVSTWRASLSP